MAPSDGRAVVVGASMAGLLTAQVLTEFFSQVTVLDRDDLTGGPVPRRGVPQSRHPHALLTGGVEALQTLFPDLLADLLQHGAELCDFQADSRLFANGRLLPQQPSGLVAVAVSRPLLEDRVRQSVLSAPGVAVVAPAQLLDLRTRDRHVTGVRVRQGGVDTDVSAELVVDATGRGSHTPTWLAGAGVPRTDWARG